MNKMKNSKRVIPNLFTTLNIFCGFLALISAAEGKVITASWLITIAGIMDTFDGQVARLTNTSSDFGVEFDSLADIISFGVAPSVILYKVHFYTMGWLGIMLSFLPLMCGGIRLARFNVLFGGKEKTNFIGLPIPLSAISFVSFVIFNYYFWNELYLSRFLVPQLILVSALMLSKVEYLVLPKMTFRHSRKNSLMIILAVISLTLLIFFPHETYYPLVMIYILWGVFTFLFQFVRNGENGKQEKLV